MKDAAMTPAEWDAFVARAETGTLFHTWAWFQGMCRAFRRTPLPLVLVDDGGEARAILPLARARFGPVTTLESPVLAGTPYGGPASAVEDFPRAIAALPGLRSLVRFDYLKMHEPPNAPVPRSLPDGFRPETGTTAVLSLRNPEKELWAGLKPTCRRKVQAARKAGLEVRSASVPDVIDQVMAWSTQAYGRYRKRAPIPRTFFENLWRELRDRSLRVFVADRAGRPVALTLVGWDRARLYSIASHFDRGTRAPGASNLVWWEAIRWGAEQGLDAFDMVGANVPSIAEFKLSFGGKRQQTFSLVWSDPLFRLANRARGILNRLRTGEPSG